MKELQERFHGGKLDDIVPQYKYLESTPILSTVLLDYEYIIQ